ncbi:MAG: pentapeptide repeat-containing protein, partial [Pseudomonas sp.]|nr:pentapeptide repeat-containing protein [Pseudomonas sp.]
RKATFIDANLQESKLSEANMAKANMTGARRHYATFLGTFMEGCTACPLDW